MKFLGKEYNTVGEIQKKNIEQYELDIKQVLSSSAHRPVISSQENIWTIPGSKKFRTSKIINNFLLHIVSQARKYNERVRSDKKISYENVTW